jgi:hypothetical protein
MLTSAVLKLIKKIMRRKAGENFINPSRKGAQRRS